MGLPAPHNSGHSEFSANSASMDTSCSRLPADSPFGLEWEQDFEDDDDFENLEDFDKLATCSTGDLAWTTFDFKNRQLSLDNF